MTAWRKALAKHYQSLAERERTAVAIGGALLVLVLLWWVGLAPALRTLKAAPAQIEALDGQLLEMQRLATEAKALRATPAVPLAQAQAALTASAQRLADKVRPNVQGERAVVELMGIDGESLSGWLSELRANARARVVEAQLTRSPQGTYTGRLTLALGGRP